MATAENTKIVQTDVIFIALPKSAHTTGNMKLMIFGNSYGLLQLFIKPNFWFVLMTLLKRSLDLSQPNNWHTKEIVKQPEQFFFCNGAYFCLEDQYPGNLFRSRNIILHVKNKDTFTARRNYS